ncbi:sacsin N-terminal ATP-binding-like domain-containing protein [[Flexibacter] sp. ATCC 35208]|uniref:sacsin N-terminal ATP-binding-like domain-containing protein n=1 Tax=[Flexibacter] sp. ATCC 35208 TaxID=1936242 RepID=UPI0009D304A4|nr:DUF3883 domain-containing protein [[Flexibacter] sp. ATCC 35208]OMP75791.1 hypothetical protein BW716_28185 [[Flexibacter] sp. ATCC 35208]
MPMLYLRNVAKFRQWYKQVKARNDDKSIDTDFVNIFHPISSRKEKGFPYLIYGTRDDIGGFLRSTSLNVAADQQAIYELIQNADDSRATFFSVTYNEDYLLCINNGAFFTDNNMSALLNIGDSDKQGDDIGTFGIGFKILHRLLGEDDGLDAIINDYAGPIIFSWSEAHHLKMFIEGKRLCYNKIDEYNSRLPWLLKIIYTCFPVSLGEEIRLKDHETEGIVFSDEELNAMRKLLVDSLESMNILNRESGQINKGSIFFLKLGPGKYKYIHDNINNLRSGISYSMNFLNSLMRVYVNGELINKQVLTGCIEDKFERGSADFNAIKPRNPNRDIRFSIAYYSDYKQSDSLNLSPNFYNFFSMDEEKNGFRFLLHCNAFDMNNDRRKLQQGSQINERLLPAITKAFGERAEKIRLEDRKDFLAIYAALILSEEPIKKPHINDFFFKPLMEFVRQNIPIGNGFETDVANVKIKEFSTDLDMQQLGMPRLKWFEWNSQKDELLVDAAVAKLGIEIWTIAEVLLNANISLLNNWITIQSATNYNVFLKEIQDIEFSDDVKSRLGNIKLLKFSDGKFYSLRDVMTNTDLIATTQQTARINKELCAIGFSISERNVSELKFTKELPSDLLKPEDVYRRIADKIQKTNLLSSEGKRNLFLNFIGTETRFIGVADATLGKLQLFKDTLDRVKPLEAMLPATTKVPEWLNQFKISPQEYFPELNNYLVPEKNIYQTFILRNWESIIAEIEEKDSFYEKVQYYFSLDPENAPLQNERFVLIKDESGEERFVYSQDIFFSEQLQSSSNYTTLANIIFSLTGKYIPHYNTLVFLKPPLFILKTEYLGDLPIEPCLLDVSDVRELINFCERNHETFFEKFCVEKEDSGFMVTEASASVHQVNVATATAKYLRDIINSNASADVTFKILPAEFNDLKNKEGVLSGEEFYYFLLEHIDFDLFAETLIDFISYSGPKIAFLEKLNKLVLSADVSYDKDTFEYKVLDMACGELKSKEIQSHWFRNKIRLIVDGKEVSMNTIPSSAEEITFLGSDIKLYVADVLPQGFSITGLLHRIISNLVTAGINEIQLKALLNIHFETDLIEILELIPKKLENAYQLAFIILYHNQITSLDLTEYFVLTLDGEYNLTYNFFIHHFNFLKPFASLDFKYEAIETIFNGKAIFLKNDGGKIFSKPNIYDNSFVCFDIKDSLDDYDKLNLLQYIFELWNNEDKNYFRFVDWSRIGGVSTRELLGFNPLVCMIVQDLAIEEELPPAYFLDWILQNQIPDSFLSDLEINTPLANIVAIRKQLKKHGSLSLIIEDVNEMLLNNTLVWMKEQNISLTGIDELRSLEKMASHINKYINENFESDEANVDSDDEEDVEEEVLEPIEIIKEFDFNTLDLASVELTNEVYQLWKKIVNDRYLIFLFPGTLPQLAKIKGFDDYIFVRFNENDLAMSDNKIYVNSNVQSSLTSLLRSLVDEGLNNEDFVTYCNIEEQLKENGDQRIIKNGWGDIERLLHNYTPEKLQRFLALIGRVPMDQLEELADREFGDEGARINSGYLGEEIVYKDLIKRFGVSRVRWTSAENPTVITPTDAYDFEILDIALQQVIFYVDAKSTTRAKFQHEKTEIFWRNSEWRFIESEPINYIIARVFGVNGNDPEIVYLRLSYDKEFPG